MSARDHGVTCWSCPYFMPVRVANGDGECRHRSPRAHRLRYDENSYVSVWPPVTSSVDVCGVHPALAALVRRGGEVLESGDDN
jgi:hypothetical protein